MAAMSPAAAVFWSRRRFLVENAGSRSPGLSGKPANDRPPTNAYWLSCYRGPGKGTAH
jgi:hypothetical protein